MIKYDAQLRMLGKHIRIQTKAPNGVRELDFKCRDLSRILYNLSGSQPFVPSLASASNKMYFPCKICIKSNLNSSARIVKKTFLRVRTSTPDNRPYGFEIQIQSSILKNWVEM
jgi:hypothetical protein